MPAFELDAVPAYVTTPEGTSAVKQIASYRASAPAPVDRPHQLVITAPDGFKYEWKDGLMVRQGGPAISQTAEQLQPPNESAAAKPSVPIG